MLYEVQPSGANWVVSSDYPALGRAIATAQFATPATNSAWQAFFRTTEAKWTITFPDGRVWEATSFPGLRINDRVPVAITSERSPDGYVRTNSFGGLDRAGYPELLQTSGSDGRSISFTWSNNAIQRADLPDTSYLIYTYAGASSTMGADEQLQKVERFAATGSLLWKEEYLYEDTNNRLLLTGVVNGLGQRQSQYLYNAFGQVTYT